MTDALDLEHVLDVARAAALASGEILMRHRGRLVAGEVTSKDVRRDLVTAADVESERALVTRLRGAFPGHAIEAEEEVHDAARAGDDPRWFLDPLDGTINYVHGLPLFAVSAGLWVGGRPVVGVVHAPALGETFCATAGGGATLNGEALHVSQTSELRDAVLATGFPYRRETLEHSNLENFSAFFYDVRGMRRMGSAALDLAYTAAGRFDGFWELHLAPHDVGAGGLLVREAGGVVTDADGGEDWLRGKSLVAAGPNLHAAICARVRH